MYQLKTSSFFGQLSKVRYVCDTVLLGYNGYNGYFNRQYCIFTVLVYFPKREIHWK